TKCQQTLVDGEFHVLIAEEAFADVVATQERIARFLGVSADEFPQGAGAARVNQAVIPRFRRAHQMALRTRRFLIDHNVYFLPKLAKRLRLKKLFGESSSGPPPMTQAERSDLQSRFAEDVAGLETLLGRRIDPWHEREATE
ncbi:MAG: hypothetical protein AAF961_06325, partial [Planctomycetota bacterium]